MKNFLMTLSLLCACVTGTDDPDQAHDSAALPEGVLAPPRPAVSPGRLRPAYRDRDGDGYTSLTDCNDSNPDVHPGAVQECAPLDQDCDGLDGLSDPDAVGEWVGFDLDGDGYGGELYHVACGTSLPSRPVTKSGGDCNDRDRSVHPSAFDADADGVDSNCDGVDGGGRACYVDADLDRNGSATIGFWLQDPADLCPWGYSETGTDCNDDPQDPFAFGTQAHRYPFTAESCDGVDNDCDGEVDNNGIDALYYPDRDGDGIGCYNCAAVLEPWTACHMEGQGYSRLPGDRYDNDPTRQ